MIKGSRKHLPLMAKTSFQVGDRVRYSSKFCRLVGAHTGWMPQVKGEITKLTGELATILWDFAGPDGVIAGGANVHNLQRLR